MVSLLFLVNSRPFQPILIAIIFLAHYLLKKYTETRSIEKTINRTITFIFSYIAIAVLTLLLYRPLPPPQFTHSYAIQFGFQLHKIIEVLIFRNSYISLLGMMFLTYFTYKNIGYIKKLIKNPKKAFGYKMIIPYFFIANILSMVFFNFPYGAISRYSFGILLFAIILQGVAIERVIKSNKKVLYVIVAIFLLLSLYQVYDASKEHPPFVLNSNFNVEKFGLIQNAYGGYNHTIYEELEKMGNPPVITNLVWLAIYYEGEVIMPPTP